MMMADASDVECGAASSFGITELEEMLLSDGGKERAEQIAEEMRAKAKVVRSVMEGGLPPNDYERATSILKGLRAAHDTLSAYARK